MTKEEILNHYTKGFNIKIDSNLELILLPYNEEDIDEVINKLYGERIELRSKIDKVSRFIAHGYVIDKIGKEQYHLLVLQMNAMSSYLNILTERINLLEYDRDNGLDQY